MEVVYIIIIILEILLTFFVARFCLIGIKNILKAENEIEKIYPAFAQTKKTLKFTVKLLEYSRKTQEAAVILKSVLKFFTSVGFLFVRYNLLFKIKKYFRFFTLRFK